MVGKKNKHRRILDYKKRKQKSLSTNKTIDKITYNPLLHKNNFNKSKRKELQQRRSQQDKPIEVTNELKFASLNVNGLDVEAATAIETLITQRSIDVSTKFHIIKKSYCVYRYLLLVRHSAGKRYLQKHQK